MRPSADRTRSAIKNSQVLVTRPDPAETGRAEPRLWLQPGEDHVADLPEFHELHAGIIQMPLSLVRLAPVADALNGTGPLIESEHAGLEAWASAPLNGGDLAQIVTPELASFIHIGLTPVQAALSVVASSPGVTRVLLSASSADHWAETTGVVSVPDATLRKVCDVLGT